MSNPEDYEKGFPELLRPDKAYTRAEIGTALSSTSIPVESQFRILEALFGKE